LLKTHNSQLSKYSYSFDLTHEPPEPLATGFRLLAVFLKPEASTLQPSSSQLKAHNSQLSKYSYSFDLTHEPREPLATGFRLLAVSCNQKPAACNHSSSQLKAHNSQLSMCVAFVLVLLKSIRAVPAAALAAVTAFEMVCFRENNQSVFHIVIDGTFEVIFFTGLICIGHIYLD
jgi:hypothetical protein